ncbi:MAG: acetyl-CoA carboxylase biotin carboxyl carrier protein [Massiliimalia sp.]|jgi:acetyl-CoA carboxylase biotin carboxyl carrier protein
MSELRLTVEEIRSLMDQMSRTGLGQMVLEDGDFKLKLSAQREQVVMAPAAVPAPVPAAAPAAAAAAPAEETGEAPVSGNVVKSPIIGTFYAAPSPDKDAFAPVGKQVRQGDVLFIIESMKLMNEVQSEFDGEVVEVLVKDGEPVEYDQPIMVIR